MVAGVFTVSPLQFKPRRIFQTTTPPLANQGWVGNSPLTPLPKRTNRGWAEGCWERKREARPPYLAAHASIIKRRSALVHLRRIDSSFGGPGNGPREWFGKECFSECSGRKKPPNSPPGAPTHRRDRRPRRRRGLRARTEPPPPPWVLRDARQLPHQPEGPPLPVGEHKRHSITNRGKAIFPLAHNPRRDISPGLC